MGCKVQICPPPKSYKRTEDHVVRRENCPSIVSVKDSQADISSPVTRLVLPVTSGKENKDEDAKTQLCRLSRRSRKVENMCGLVEVGENWFGFLYSWSDNKKKSSLMLSVFDSRFGRSAMAREFTRLGRPVISTRLQNFLSVKSDRKPSYSSYLYPVVWISSLGFNQIYKRYCGTSRKLPDKTPHFYKELNRLKRRLFAWGSTSCWRGVAQICERECGLLPATT